MSNKETLQTNNNKINVNNASLTEILNTINSLPEASQDTEYENVYIDLKVNLSDSTPGVLVSYYYYNGINKEPRKVTASQSYGEVDQTINVMKGSEIHCVMDRHTGYLTAPIATGVELIESANTSDIAVLIAKVNSSGALTIDASI